jgi:hypothetical protein
MQIAAAMGEHWANTGRTLGEHKETAAAQGLTFLRLAAGTHYDGAAVSIRTARQC